MAGDDSIRCGWCGKKQARMRFSNTQLMKHENDRQYGGRGNIDLPLCRSCTGEPAASLECYGCGGEFRRETFSNTQRKNKDKRLCPDCSQAKQDRVPDVEDAIQEERIYEEQTRQAGGEDCVWSGSALRSTVSSSSVISVTASRYNDEVWVQQPQSPRGEASTCKSDSDKDETSTQMGMSTAASDHSNGTWGDWADSNAIEQTYRREGGLSATSNHGETGWHKQGAVKMTARERAHQRIATEAKKRETNNEQDEQLSSDPDSDDSDDFEM